MTAPLALRLGRRLAAKLFDGRRSHGGAQRPSYLQVTESDLALVLATAFELGAEHAQSAIPVGEATELPVDRVVATGMPE